MIFEKKLFFSVMNWLIYVYSLDWLSWKYWFLIDEIESDIDKKHETDEVGLW